MYVYPARRKKKKHKAYERRLTFERPTNLQS